MAIQSPDPLGSVDEVIEAYARLVYRLAYARVRNSHDADDIFQDVFLSYVRSHPVFASEEHRKAWLIRVTINACKKLALSRWIRNTAPLDESIASPFNMPEENELHHLLLKLTPNYRTVLHLFYYEEMSIEQISQAMKAKPATIRTWLTRARRQLRHHVEEEKNPDGQLTIQKHERADRTKPGIDPIDSR